jgi:hypothetical protein
MNLTICPDCNAPISNLDGPTHEYMGAPAGCWKIFGEVLAREYSDREYWAVHRLTVDAYAAQHASGDDPRQVQSVTVHLLALYLTLDRGLPEDEARKIMELTIQRTKSSFQKLEKPSFVGILNVSDIAKAKTAAEHKRLVTEWAQQVWSAWQPAHTLICSLTSTICPSASENRRVSDV